MIIKSRYVTGWWDNGDVGVKSDDIFADREQAVEFLQSIMRQHREDGRLYDYYKVFEYLKEVKS